MWLRASSSRLLKLPCKHCRANPRYLKGFAFSVGTTISHVGGHTLINLLARRCQTSDDRRGRPPTETYASMSARATINPCASWFTLSGRTQDRFEGGTPHQASPTAKLGESAREKQKNILYTSWEMNTTVSYAPLAHAFFGRGASRTQAVALNMPHVPAPRGVRL